MQETERAVVAPRYASILVAVDQPASSSKARVKLAAELAKRFDSRLLGCAAEPLEIMPVLEPMGIGLNELVEADRKRIDARLAKAKELFFAEADSTVESEWRQQCASMAEWIVQQSRGADLIVTGGLHGVEGAAATQMLWDAGDILLRSGRPVLFVPAKVAHLSAKRIVVGWKDTREARRAIQDALPLLAGAEHVTLLSVGKELHGAQEVVSYLEWQGVKATCAARPAPEADAAATLLQFASVQDADLVVCGGYGHGRTREWLFGGVTRDLLHRAEICCLLSH